MRRREFAAFAAAAIGPAVAGVARAQAYPERGIRLVVPYAAGGSVDIVARLIADEWGKALGGSFYIDNKGGAGGNLGVDLVAKAPPDGHTVGVQSVSLAINPALTPRMPYDTLNDLAPIGMIATSQHVLVVNDALGPKTVSELIAKAKSAPGRLSYGSAGAGSTFHIAAELFKATAGVSIVHIPYRGGGPALVDTISGQVDMSFPVVSAARPHVQAGKVRALGVTGRRRSPLLPDVPTIAEAGLPGYAFETWFVAFAPAGTPKAVVDRLNAALNRALQAPAVRERMVGEGYDPVVSTPAEARARIEREMPVWAKLVRERGIKAE